MNQLAKDQLQQVQNPKQVNATERISMMVNKRRQKGPQVQNCAAKYVQENSGFYQDDSYSEQDEEVQYVNKFQGQRNKSEGANQQQWRFQGNQGEWNSNNQGNWNSGNNQGNWNNNNNQGNRSSGNNQGS
ncbi:uncharacterized protein [Nicotiana sylvestris]|uniref:uncharacterized protein n=1 Tax=Nicotiana sylvestris TaxID=4096 RepID=UPI00388CE3B2